MNTRYWTRGLMLLAVGCGEDLQPESDADAGANPKSASAMIASASSAGAGRTAPNSSTTMAASPNAPSTAVAPVAPGGAPMTNATAASTPTSAGRCPALQLCCGSLTDATLRGTCQAVASSQAEQACEQVAQMLCSSPKGTAAMPVIMDDAGVASMTTPPSAVGKEGCMALSACCSTLEEEDKEDCQAAVDAADPMMCSDTLAELCPDPNAPATPMPAED